MVASPHAARRTKLGRQALASLVAACLLMACSGKDEEPVTADKLRSDLAQRVAERGAAGVSGVRVANKGSASATLQIGDNYTTFGSVAGKGSEQTQDQFMFGRKAADQLPLQQVIDAATSTVSSCEALGETRGVAAAQLVVAPQGQVVISRICTPSAADVVVGQSLDGKDLPELGQVDAQKTLAQVMGEYQSLLRGSDKTVGLKISYGPGVLGPMAPGIQVFGPQATNAGRKCYPSVKHTHLKVKEGDPGTGLSLPCEEFGVHDDPANNIAFGVNEAPAAKIAAVLEKLHQKVPRDEVRNATVSKTPQGEIVVQVVGEKSSAALTIDGRTPKG